MTRGQFFIVIKAGSGGHEHVADLKRLRRLSDAFFANSRTFVRSDKASNASAMLAFSDVSFLPLMSLPAPAFIYRTCPLAISVTGDGSVSAGG